jgi:hypothetical protein
MITRQSAPVGGVPFRQSVVLVLFLLVFLGLIAGTGGLGRLDRLEQPWTLVLVGLAAFRGGRALAYNFIFSWLRAPFTRVVPDSSGAGDSIQASGEGLRRALGELVACPICAGTWVALVLTGCILLVYPFGMALTFVLAAAGAAEILNGWSGRDEWQARAAREQAGSAWLSKNVSLDHQDDAPASQGAAEPLHARSGGPFLAQLLAEPEWQVEHSGGERKVRHD